MSDQITKQDVDDIKGELRAIRSLLHGDDAGSFGLLQKVNIMWRVHAVWPFATGSALAGALLTLLVMWFGRKIGVG